MWSNALFKILNFGWASLKLMVSNAISAQAVNQMTNESHCHPEPPSSWSPINRKSAHKVLAAQHLAHWRNFWWRSCRWMIVQALYYMMHREFKVPCASGSGQCVISIKACRRYGNMIASNPPAATHALFPSTSTSRSKQGQIIHFLLRPVWLTRNRRSESRKGEYREI